MTHQDVIESIREIAAHVSLNDISAISARSTVTMSWSTLLDLIADECGIEAAQKIEKKARESIGGTRITVSAKRTVTAKMLEQEKPGKPRQAAKNLGIHPSTAYRKLKTRLIR